MSTGTHEITLPVIDTTAIAEVADAIWVIPDSDYTPLVPNIGIIVGPRATLVIDTGFGPENARAVLQQARTLSRGGHIFLTHTHCHPEHGFGANAITDEVTTVYNDAQWIELQEKGRTLLPMFKDKMPALAGMLDGVDFVVPDIRYSGSLKLDLGGDMLVELHEVGGAHSRGDQAIIVHGSRTVVFSGDLVEEKTFAILGDNESHVLPWIDRLNRLEQMNPEIVVPGHGHVGGAQIVRDYRAALEFAKRRVAEIRETYGNPESEIVEQVTDELLALHPDWRNAQWAGRIVADLSWPARR